MKISQYFIADGQSNPRMVVRRKHNSYSYWNYAVKKWYGCNDAKYYSKTEISETKAIEIIDQDKDTI